MIGCGVEIFAFTLPLACTLPLPPSKGSQLFCFDVQLFKPWLHQEMSPPSHGVTPTGNPGSATGLQQFQIHSFRCALIHVQQVHILATCVTMCIRNIIFN